MRQKSARANTHNATYLMAVNTGKLLLKHPSNPESNAHVRSNCTHVCLNQPGPFGVSGPPRHVFILYLSICLSMWSSCLSICVGLLHHEPTTKEGSGRLRYICYLHPIRLPWQEQLRLEKELRARRQWARPSKWSEAAIGVLWPLWLSANLVVAILAIWAVFAVLASVPKKHGSNGL